MQQAQFQRGDIVDVSLCDGEFTYRGVVFSSSKRHGVQVITRASGHNFRNTDVGISLKLIQRQGRKPSNELFKLAQQYH